MNFNRHGNKEIKIKLRSFKSSEHINEESDGPYILLKAVQQLTSGKAPGADASPTEVYKAGGYQWQRN